MTNRTNPIEIPDRIELWPLDRLKPYARNARTHSAEQVGKIAASIVEFGFTNPILVDGKDGIIAGHGRLMAAQRLKLPQVPVVVLDHLTDAQRRAYILADNRLALDAGWDEAMLASEMEQLQVDGFDLSLTGFSEAEIAGMVESVSAPGKTDDPDDAPAAPTIPTSCPGDVWILGPHRVMCGDSTNIQHAERLMDGSLADALWTDPPYNVAYEGGTKEKLKIQNDSMDDGSFRQFLFDIYVTAFSVMRTGAPAYIAHADTEGLNFRAAFKEAGFKLSGCLIWRKNSMVLGRSDYQWQHEPILYGWKPGSAHSWYGARNKTTIMEMGESVFQQVGEHEWQICLGEQTLVIRGEGTTVERVSGSVFFEEKPNRNGEHPTMKPVGLIQRMLENYTQRSDVVLDLFGGSGSTLMACQVIGRRARLMELDPKYVDVIVRRWQDFTGQKAILEDDGWTFDEAVERRAPVGL